jgi:uncharacterized repeat protein (TIGR03803 family)
MPKKRLSLALSVAVACFALTILMGNLYGTTEGDGNTTFGSVFEVTP